MDWLLNNNNSVLDRGSDWFTGIRAKVWNGRTDNPNINYNC